MRPTRYDHRTIPSPVVLAACLLEIVEKLYARVIAVSRLAGQDDLADITIAEFEAWRDEWRPYLERIINKGR